MTTKELKMDKIILLLFCGYKNTFIDKFKVLLDEAHEYIIKNNVPFVIGSGASTGGLKSEGAIIKDYLDGLGWKEMPKAPLVYADGRPITTDGNISNAQEIAQYWEIFDPTKYRLVVFCDSGHREKVNFFSRRFFPNFEIEIHHRPICKGFAARYQPLFTYYDMAGYYFPPLKTVKLIAKLLAIKLEKLKKAAA